MKNLKDYILVIENVLSNELCDNIIAEFSNEDEWSEAEVYSGSNLNLQKGVDENMRKCKIINMSESDCMNKNLKNRKKLDDDIFYSVSKIFQTLNTKYPELNIEVDSGYDLLKYEVGDFLTEHTDNGREKFRTISCSMCLNDDYNGGEFAFFDRKLIFKQKKGSALLFPSNFMFPHEIMPVIAGIRYSIVTWFN